MTLKQLKKKLIDCPGYRENGAATVAKHLGVSEKMVRKAKKELREEERARDLAEIQPKVNQLQYEEPEIIQSNGIYKPVQRLSNLGGFNINKLIDVNTLVIPDTHEPFCKAGVMEHCYRIKEKYNCTRVVHIGDEVDACAISQWEHDPDGMSAGDEAILAQAKMKQWYLNFPEVYVCIGNHTARPFRLAKTAGIPSKFIKTYRESWEAPEGWKWADSWEFDGVHFTHGTGHSGPRAAITVAMRYQMNVVMGHIHSEAGIQYSANKHRLVWGMQVGGAIDDKSYAAAYAKDQLKKSIVGCGVILNNGTLPVYEPMKL